ITLHVHLTFLFKDTAPTDIYTLSLHDALPISPENVARLLRWLLAHGAYHRLDLANRRLPPQEDALLGHGHMNLQTDLGKLDVLRSEEHTSELQSQSNLVCRLLLEKKKKKDNNR